jgi:hypothetical protein
MLVKLLTLLTVGIAWQARSQETSHVKVSDFFGYYLTEVAEDPFPNFNQLEIGPCDSTSKPEVVCGLALFWGDSSIASAYSDRRCRLRTIHITKDSLSFRTDECVDEVYAFVGHWLLPGGTFERDPRPPVLEGTMSHYVKGKLSKKAAVRFLYSPGE